MRYFYVVLAATLAADASATLPDTPCLKQAAEHHRVSAEVLRAIVHIESEGDPVAVGMNRNGSIDRGLGGTNSVHLPELKKHGVTKEDLHDPCISIYTTAWLLARAVRRHGDSWYGYAAYHSTTPYYNHRYQVLLHNELVRRGAKKGQILSVPPLKPKSMASASATASPAAP